MLHSQWTAESIQTPTWLKRVEIVASCVAPSDGRNVSDLVFVSQRNILMHILSKTSRSLKTQK